MLSSIHPLGERARNNRWWVTVSAFALGAITAGAATGAVLGLVGNAILGDLSSTTRLGVTAGVVTIGGVLDLRRVKPWGSSRQVNENWIGHFRGWVYGGAFGVQLGAGVLTYVVTWGVYSTLAAEILTGSAALGALVGAVFGLGRSLALILAVRIDIPSRLTSFHRRMADLGPPLQRSAALSSTGIGVLAIMGLMV
jgi:sulfite exporter TauE/SafE